jgi:acyl transferase domain-containing protein/NAD(P)-dependent dehydrogenase (short-subunit alcohol dehydrogenase family)/acyl carrier protein
MESTAYRAIAIVGTGAVLPDAANVPAFWENVKQGRYSITEVAPERWDPALYFDSDHSAPDKTYSKIGGWVREWKWEPAKWRLPIPPRVVDAMDEAQRWAIACTREALEDYGYPNRPLNADRTAVILGNAMAGEKHYLTALRVYFPEYASQLSQSASFAALPDAARRDITRELHDRIAKIIPDITEDTMPGELANCIAGRIANVFNFHGPNYVVDAACASAMAAISSAAEGLIANDFDVAITGGIDRNMGASTYVKFSKIGALSASGTRPYAEGADGFVMGEGAAIFVLKRLADAERDGDKIYAVLRGVGGASDGKGKGITAPNPVGQKLAIERAWHNAGISPATVTLMEGHGTSTSVGDVVEVQSMAEVLGSFDLPVGSVALGSVKSNIGHLKGAAGAAGLLKAALALRDNVLPPSVHCEHPNPNIDFAHSPLYVNREFRPWTVPADRTRRAGVSAFGFGGTNFHLVLEEFIPHKLTGNGKRLVAVTEMPAAVEQGVAMYSKSVTPVVTGGVSRKAPLRGAFVVGAATEAELVERLSSIQEAAAAGDAPSPVAPADSDLLATERIAIDYADAADLAIKSAKAIKALKANQAAIWKALRSQGIFRGHGAPGKVAFLYTGQGSQYVNMLAPLRAAEPIVAELFDEADRIMTPLLGKPLTDYIFVDQTNADAVAKAEEDLRQTEITQPTVLTIDLALTRMLAAFGIRPDMTMGHSLGEYGALVASGSLTFENALAAVSARGRGMTQVAVDDKGKMAAVFAPLDEVERILKTIQGYVVIANINSGQQSVIGGASHAVEQATEIFLQAGYNVVPLPVSHAFHTSIVAPASEPLREMLSHLHMQSARVPVVANVTGEFYPTGSAVVPQMLDLLARQVACPVQFVKGLRTLYDAGARIFIEVGPKKALQGFAEEVLGDRGDVITFFTNHPKVGDTVSFNQALCGLYAAGLGCEQMQTSSEITAVVAASVTEPSATAVAIEPIGSTALPPTDLTTASSNGDRYSALGHLLAGVLDKASEIYYGQDVPAPSQPVVITGAAMGLPGTEHVFDDGNVARILRGDQFIKAIPPQYRNDMLAKRITRLVKSESGEARFDTIEDVADVIKLAGRGGEFDLEKEFGVSAERLAALDRVTRLAIAVGIDAMRDAGIPLVMRYKTTSKGTLLPDRWGLPDALRDDTGVIMGSAFPGYDSYADEMARYYADHARRKELASLENMIAAVAGTNGHSPLAQEMVRKIEELRAEIDCNPYIFDRRFLLKTLSMGHSQFAEFVGARGPNTQINSACATTSHAISLAEDWIRAGRCSRVIIITADDVTSDHLIGWFGAGFLASGAAATDELVEEAATPFDRRRHGLIMGMGAAGLVVESAQAASERGVQPICEVLSAVTANSAFHGTRLDVQHICQVMENMISQAELQSGIERHQIAPRTVFVSHETYTPARGGSASAEIYALRRVFGDAADQIVIANTKGLTGHAMATGIEEVLAVKALETGVVPPVANFKEIDPELGALNLSKGGTYPIEYALRLGAGFGSQISMSLLRWVPAKDGTRRSANDLGYAYRIADKPAWDAWLATVAGRPAADLEVVNRTLRVRDQGLSARVAEVARDAKPQSALTVAVQAPPPAPTIQTLPSAELPIVAAKPEPTSTPTREMHAKPEVQVPVAAEVPLTQPKPDPAGDSVKDRVLALVAEKTGYPIDMLDLDLDLEADLGVDTVKQAEVMATIREAYGFARDDQIKLRDYPTLAHVIRFVNERRTDVAVGPPTAVATEAKTTSEPSASSPDLISAPEAVGDGVKERILDQAVEKTGYPRDMLDLDLDLEADLGVDTVKQAEMFAAIREIYSIPRDENRKLRDYPTLAHVIRFVYENRPDLAAVTPTARPTAEPAAAPAPSTPSQLASDDAIKEKVLEIVAEKTGYPKDMLDLDLDLEADLGVDTVKQAEMFASVRAAYNIPREENLKLRDFPTLAHVIQFARDKQNLAVTTDALAPAAAAASVAAKPDARPRPPLASFDAADQIPRRIPVPILRPPLNICKPTCINLGQGRRVVIMPDQAGVAEILTQRLQSMGVEVLSLDAKLDETVLTELLKSWITAGPIQGVYWLPALDDEGPLNGMHLDAWHEALRVRIKLLYATMRTLYGQVAKPGTFLVSATRLGGMHGYDGAGAVAPLGGAVVGFTKTYKRERSEALVKVVDFEVGRNDSEVAETIIEETLRDPGAVEIGYSQDLRWTVGLQEQPLGDGQHSLTLGPDSVFVITGAAGSIVSAITADLAAASGGTFYLLDLVPTPDPSNPDLGRFLSDKEGLKRDLFERIKARGERATPALVEKELASLERAQAAQSAIDAVRSAGGTPYYFSVDLTNADGVTSVINQARQRSGRIDVLVHAAGIERSHFLPDKDQREFDLVFDVKSDGWFNLLCAIGDMPLGATVAFSSIAGRFGNAGQTDYSAANDLLCKITSSFRTTRPATRGIVIDWTAWSGIGMATRGSIPKMMEAAGIDMLPPEAGVPLTRRELTSAATHGELVVAQRLGIMVNEWDETGGLDTQALAELLVKQTPAQGPMVGRITGMTLSGGLTMETTLDPAAQAFLYDHRIEGTPVLPGVMGMEAFAEAALCVHPGWHIEAIEEVNFLAPFKFYRDEPRTVFIQAQFYPQGDRLVADCRLVGRRTLPNLEQPQQTTHFTARVMVTKQAPAASAGIPLQLSSEGIVNAAQIYRIFFHGPAYQVLDSAWRDGERIIGQMSEDLPGDHNPSEGPTLIGPRMIELCFQTAGLLEISEHNRIGLPLYVHHVSWSRPPALAVGPLFAVVTPDMAGEKFDAEVVDTQGNRYLQLTGYRTVALPEKVDAAPLHALQNVTVSRA